MNRTNDRDFFRLWDFECSLEKMRETHLSPKQLAEFEALEEQFFEELGNEMMAEIGEEMMTEIIELNEPEMIKKAEFPFSP